MTRLFSLLLGLVFLASCNLLHPGCLIHDKVEEAATSAIVNSLQCSSPSAVQADVHKVLAPLNLCQSETGLISATFCPIAVGAVVGLASKAVPSSWGCSAQNAQAGLSAALTAACMQIPVEQK
jgi:hypothetical protein